VRQADAPHLPSSARYAIWAAELGLLLLALWQAVRALGDTETVALGVSFLGVVLFLTAVHVVIAVDERFTTPALPLVGLFAGACLAQLGHARPRVAVGYAQSAHR
jgi:ABC-type enterochelin transport system permease subunit